MRSRTMHSLPVLAVAIGTAGAVWAQPVESGVTDFTDAEVGAIGISDIVDALAVPRGVQFDTVPPPTARLPVLFAFDSADLGPGRNQLLDKIGAAFAGEQLAGYRFSIDGHTDSVGPEDYNDQLSKRRALTVKEYLVAQGIAADRLQAVGHGEAKPHLSNHTSDGRRRNRRVDLRNLGPMP